MGIYVTNLVFVANVTFIALTFDVNGGIMRSKFV